jgi:hypothetical protein
LRWAESVSALTASGNEKTKKSAEKSSGMLVFKKSSGDSNLSKIVAREPKKVARFATLATFFFHPFEMSK